MKDILLQILDENLGKEETFDSIMDYVIEKENEQGYDELNDIEKYSFILGKLLMDVTHDGFDQYFLNTSGTYAKDIVEFLDHIGDKSFPKIIEEGISIYRAVIPDDVKTAEFEMLDQKFYEIDTEAYDRLYDRFIDYLRSNKELIFC